MAWTPPSITRGVTRITYDWMLNLLNLIGEGFYPTRSRAWWQRLARRRYDKVRIVTFAGDSWAHPTGAETPAQGWYSIVAERLGRGSSGRSVTIQAPHSSTRNGTTVDENANPHMVTLKGTDLWTIGDLGEYDAIDIVYLRVGDAANPDYGPPRWVINQNMTDIRTTYDQDIDLYSPGSSYRIARIANWTGDQLGLGSHATAPEGTVVFCIIAHKGSPDRGVEWINFAQPGWSSQQWRDVLGNWQIREPAMALKGDLLHIALGPNDALKGVTIPKMVENLRDIVVWYRTNVAEVPVFWTIIPWPDSSAITEAAWNERMDAIVTLSKEFEGSIISDWRKWGKQTTLSRLVISPTDYHKNKFGHDYAADDVVKELDH